jgi:hypothetical protein
MHQDMKNFLDITAIDINNQIEVEIELIGHHSPDYTFTVNDLPVQPKMYFGLLDNLNFCCNINNGAVEVAKIIINGYEVLPVYQHLADPATNWITQNWTFTISGPFYPWYHEITGQGWTA